MQFKSFKFVHKYIKKLCLSKVIKNLQLGIGLTKYDFY